MGKHKGKGAKGMRKVILVVVSILLSGAVLLVLCCNAVLPDRTEAVRGLFPMAVENTPLRVLRLSPYNGPFWEDRSTASVVSTGALLVENTGQQPLESGAVVLEWAQARLIFELEHLQPGQQVLVLEKDGQVLPEEAPAACYGWSDCGSGGETGVVVEDIGGCTVAVTNCTEKTIGQLRLCYKTCRDGICLGGSCCTAQVQDLQPGERRLLRLRHYICGQSTVVHICSAS